MGSRKVPFLENPLYRKRRFYAGTAQRNSSGCRRAGKCALRYAYFITCTGVEKDSVTGAITAVHCTYDPATRGGSAPDGRSPKSTMHWVSASRAITAEVRLYDYLFTKENPDDVPEGMDFKSLINPKSACCGEECPHGTEPCKREGRRQISVRTGGIFLRRQRGLQTRQIRYSTEPYCSGTPGRRYRRSSLVKMRLTAKNAKKKRQSNLHWNYELTFFGIGSNFYPEIRELWGCSSVGRASGWQSGGRRFDPVQLHHKNL